MSAIVMGQQAQLVVARAKTQIGYKEGANNLTKYGQWYGIPNGYWCAMFVSWVFSTEHVLPLIAQTPKGFANCEDMHMWAHTHGLIVPTASVQAGDILLYGEKNKAEHTGIAVGKIDKTHTFPAVEGNTSADHSLSTNGDGVYLKQRNPSWVVAVVRPLWTA